MLLRMYLRWAERRGFDVELDEVSPGHEAGIVGHVHRQGPLRVRLLQSRARRAPAGPHLAVRPPGTPPDRVRVARRPAVPRATCADVEIDDKDLRIDTYRSSGAGGQHVNVTDSAVRITHLPTGIVVSCQNERTQLQNKDRAMQILAAKLAERAAPGAAGASSTASRASKREVGFGSQIRTYVLAPYQMVKDVRTEYETGNVAGVLDGDLDGFIEAYLQWRQSARWPAADLATGSGRSFYRTDRLRDPSQVQAACRREHCGLPVAVASQPS